MIVGYVSELRELVKMHGTKAHENEEPLSHDEVIMMSLILYGDSF